VTSVGNPYTVLGVDPTASTEEIQCAFRRAIRDAHPDLHADAPTDHVTITRLVAAWRIVGDPRRRAAFDRTATSTGTSTATSTATSTVRPPRRPDRHDIDRDLGTRTTLLVRLFVVTAIAATAFLTALFVIAMSQSG
jgi:curved DNA-binding protein CbpA